MRTKLKHYYYSVLNNSGIKTILRNIFLVVGSNGISMLLGFVSTAIILRKSGLLMFGQMALIIAYVQTIDSIVNFQSWQALIKFGSLNDEKNNEKLTGYVKEAFLIDITTAIIGTVIAVCFSSVVGQFLNWSDEMVRIAQLYSMKIVFHLEGMPIGYLRIINKFKDLSVLTVIIAIEKIAGSLIYFYRGETLQHLAILYFIIDISLYIFQFIITVKYLKQNNSIGFLSSKMHDFRDFLRFTIYTNIASTLDIPIKQLDVFIISKVLSTEMVAIQKLFNSILNIFNNIFNPVSQVLYPQIAKDINENKIKSCVEDAKKVGKIIFVFGIITSVILGISAPVWVNLLYGKAVAAYSNVLFLNMIFRVFSMSFIALHPIFLAMNFVKQNVLIMFASNLVYFVGAIFLGKNLGLYGIAIAYLFQLLIVVAMKYKYISKNIKGTI